MTRRGRRFTGYPLRRGAQGTPSWRTWLTNPLVLQAIAILLLVLALLTGLNLVHLTSGRWIDAWVGFLRYLFGWGTVPVTFALGAGGILILRHQLDRPVVWRWRPVVGLEMLFFGLLALTHLVLGRSDPWGLVEQGWGGGLVGWAFAFLLEEHLGPLVAGILLAAVVLLGAGLAFDLTLAEVREALTHLRPQPPSRPAARRPSPTSRQATPPPPPPSRQPRRKPPAKPPPPAPQPPPAEEPPPQPKTLPLTAAALPEELKLPPLDLLEEGAEAGLSDEEIREKSRIIVETLASFGLPVEVVEVRRGPTITQFGIAPGYTERTDRHGRRRAQKVRVSQIAALADDLALALAAPSLRVEAPVPGRPVVGIEVPNDEIGLVTLRSVMESEPFHTSASPLTVALGEDVSGEPVVADLAMMPHLLIAGTTGSGKSVCIKAMATCLAMTNQPDELRFVMIDPKMVEMVRFNGLPHLLGRTEHDLDRIGRVLRWVAQEMDRRYRLFAASGARNIDDYNRRIDAGQAGERLPRIVVFIDELADLMMLAPDQTERTICRIAQMARATGIHLIVATQRPSVDVVTGLIKANFPARISFATASQVDSRVILDMPGAETLLGRGDMLYLASDAGHPIRVQGCFVSDAEIERVVSFWREQTGGWTLEPPWEKMMPAGEEKTAAGPDEEDALLQQAIELVKRRSTITASYLQRRLRIGYPRAARLIEQLEEMGLIGPQEAAGRPRRVIGGEEE